MANKVQCPNCQNIFQPVYIGDIVFDRFFSRLFLEVVRRVQSGLLTWKAEVNNEPATRSEYVRHYFLASSLTDKNDCSRVHDLKCWGLLCQRPDWYHQGIYELTPMAFQFLRGQISIPRKITVNKKSQQVIAAEGVTSLRDALQDRVPGWEDFLRDWLAGKPEFENGQGTLF